ncbi:MAG: DUF2461 domain-containing protein [Bacteroidetes bacterium]|nr:MAG: DUF2461 domain-containing protein [Bacteroidota bacterium]
MNISKENLAFLSALKKNNTRDWFNPRKEEFKKHEKEAKEFFQSVENRMNETDQIEGYKVFRIYRDVRFSADKTPFKARFAGSFSRATAALRGGYYLNIEPGNSIAGGGFYAPNPEDLKRIRMEFDMDDSEIREIMSNPKFKTTFGDMQGDELKSAPKGFDKESKAIDLIRKKQFYFIRHFSDAEVLSPDFEDKVIDSYLTIRPYFDYMSSALTTDLNGESIL